MGDGTPHWLWAYSHASCRSLNVEVELKQEQRATSHEKGPNLNPRQNKSTISPDIAFDRVGGPMMTKVEPALVFGLSVGVLAGKASHSSGKSHPLAWR